MKPDERLAEIRRRGQRRLKLRRVVAALVAAAVVVAVGAVTLHQLAPQHGTVVAGRGHTATPASTTQPIPSVAPPAVAVVHLPTKTGQPGQIIVLDIQTGAVLRVLGTEYDPYPENGFQLSADRRTIYYVHLDEPAQKVETVSVPLGGGTPQVVRVGIRPAPSDDGTLLALLSAAPVSLEVLDPRGGIHHTYALPPASGKNDFVTYAWQRGSRRLLAIDIGLPIDSCSDGPFPPPSSCPSPPTLPTTAWSLDTSSATSTWEPIHPSQSLPSWKGMRVIGPGRLPGSVVAEQDLPGSSRAIAVLTVSQSGAVIDRVPMAPDTSILSADQSGTNFLVTYPGGLGRMSLNNPTPIHLADAVSEASW